MRVTAWIDLPRLGDVGGGTLVRGTEPGAMLRQLRDRSVPVVQEHEESR
jgi:hypothetical protein